MALLKIARMGHPVLKRPALPVEDPTSPEIRRLVADMIETMEDAGGTGLAAPQVHVPLRVVVFYVSAARAAREDAARGEPGEAEEQAGVPLTVLINPELEMLTENQVSGWEGCLSVPGLAGEVPRYTALRYRATDLEGRQLERTAQGFHARVVQHECDHLDGILYPQRMTDLSSLTFTSEIAAAQAESGAAEREPEQSLTQH